MSTWRELPAGVLHEENNSPKFGGVEPSPGEFADHLQAFEDKGERGFQEILLISLPAEYERLDHPLVMQDDQPRLLSVAVRDGLLVDAKGWVHQRLLVPYFVESL